MTAALLFAMRDLQNGGEMDSLTVVSVGLKQPNIVKLKTPICVGLKRPYIVKLK